MHCPRGRQNIGTPVNGFTERSVKKYDETGNRA